jgi:hypothetical protein
MWKDCIASVMEGRVRHEEKRKGLHTWGSRVMMWKDEKKKAFHE